MSDKFFSKQFCDRCSAELISRTMSWFTTECLCLNCRETEDEIRNKLPDQGASYEGCGYIPTITA